MLSYFLTDYLNQVPIRNIAVSDPTKNDFNDLPEIFRPAAVVAGAFAIDMVQKFSPKDVEGRTPYDMFDVATGSDEQGVRNTWALSAFDTLGQPIHGVEIGFFPVDISGVAQTFDIEKIVETWFDEMLARSDIEGLTVINGVGMMFLKDCVQRCNKVVHVAGPENSDDPHALYFAISFDEDPTTYFIQLCSAPFFSKNNYAPKSEQH